MKKQVCLSNYFKKLPKEDSIPKVKSEEPADPLKNLNFNHKNNYEEIRKQLKAKTDEIIKGKEEPCHYISTGLRAKRVNKTYSIEEKKAILELATSISPGQISKDYRIPYSTLKEWINNPQNLEDKRKRNKF